MSTEVGEERYFSAASASSQRTLPSTDGSSPLSDGGASVSSEALDALLDQLQLQRGRGQAGRALSETDSDAEWGPPCSGGGLPGPGSPVAAATTGGPAGAGRQEAGSGYTTPPRSPPPQPQPSAAPVAAGWGGDVAVINLLSSSSSGSDEENWSVARRPTTQRKRQVIDSSSSSSSDEGEEEDLSPGPKGARSSEDERSPSPRTRRAVPPYFAGIGPLKNIQLNSPPKPPAQPNAAPKAAAGPGVTGAARRQPPAAGPSLRKPAARSPAKAPQSAAAFKRQREQLTRQLFEEYNRRIFDGQLPADLEIRWNNRLSTTAGLTHYRRDIPPELHLPPRYSAHVELSAKVLDAQSKLERTLCHELCHVAAWLLDHTAKPPHGPMFKKWADRAMRVFPHLDITTCHSYEIFYAFRWQCSNAECGQTYGRHSNSIDVSKKVCGECKGRLVFLGRFQQDGTPAKPRAASAFSKFVQKEYQGAKERAPPGTPHADIMKTLSSKWASRQQQQQQQQQSGAAGAQAGGGGSSVAISLLDDLDVL